LNEGVEPDVETYSIVIQRWKVIKSRIMSMDWNVAKKTTENAITRNITNFKIYPIYY